MEQQSGAAGRAGECKQSDGRTGGRANERAVSRISTLPVRGGDYRGDGGTRPPNILVGGCWTADVDVGCNIKQL